MEFFAKLMKSIAAFLGLCGAPAVKVSADILEQVAQGGTTPAQVANTIADIEALLAAAGKASEACQSMNGSQDHSVVSAQITGTF